MGFNVSFRTVHLTRRGHASVTVGVCFYLVERSRSARRKEPRRACSQQTNRNKPLEAGGVHCIISSTKVTQEPQRMRHRTTLFSAKTPNVARARKTPHPLKKRKVRKLVTFKIKRLDVVKPLLLQKCNTQATRMNASRRLKHKIDSRALKPDVGTFDNNMAVGPRGFTKYFSLRHFTKIRI